jgi:hypothetical protein
MLKNTTPMQENCFDADIVDIKNFTVTCDDTQCIAADDSIMFAVPLVLFGKDQLDKIRFSTKVLTYE